MSTRKDLARQYKERIQQGGVYQIRNTQTGRYLLGHAADIASPKNRFEFALATKTCLHPRVRADWDVYGSASFVFDVLETLNKTGEQTDAQFEEDLRVLEELWRPRLDGTEYP